MVVLAKIVVVLTFVSVHISWVIHGKQSSFLFRLSSIIETVFKKKKKVKVLSCWVSFLGSCFILYLMLNC